MQAPGFWFNPPDRPGLAARLLAPLGAVYAGATARRLARGTPFRADIPVICAGNLNAGGTGKTPTVIAVLERLADRGIAAMVVTRGHGGRLVGPVAVRPDRQRDGLGRLLMTAMIDSVGPDAPLMLIGDPEYYERFFGFTARHTGQWRLPGPFEPRRLLARGRVADAPGLVVLDPDR